MNLNRKKLFWYLIVVAALAATVVLGISIHENAKYQDPQYHGGPVSH